MLIAIKDAEDREEEEEGEQRKSSFCLQGREKALRAVNGFAVCLMEKRSDRFPD